MDETESEKLVKELEENTLEVINQLILDKQYNSIIKLFENNKNLKQLSILSSEIVQICKNHLTDLNYEKDLELYTCAENLLKLLAQHAGKEEILFELLELVESTKSDNVFTSCLKGLQISLIRQQKNRPRSLEWALNSIQSYINELPVPKYLKEGYDEQQERLLEQNADIHRILTSYITLSYFWEPIYNEIRQNSPKESVQFKSTKIISENILACFILQLLGKPLAMLDLQNDLEDKKTSNSHSVQCAEILVRKLSELLGDPYYLLYYIEIRCRWPKKYSSNDGVYEKASNNCFMIEEKCPLIALGIFYYLIICEGMMPTTVPKIYEPIYIFETCIHLVGELCDCDMPNIQHKGLLLGEKLIENIHQIQLTAELLELKIIPKLFRTLTNIIIFSNWKYLRTSAMAFYEKIINQFNDEGKYFLLINLIKTTDHSGLLGHLTISFKNLIANLLKNEKLPVYFSKTNFKYILLNYVCKLKNDVETNLMENYDQIISALNIVRFFLILDKENQTGFFDCFDKIQTKFLDNLRKSIDLSRAHYKMEEHRVRNDIKIAEEQGDTNLSILNGDPLPDLSKDEKIKMLSSALINFDLLDCLLGRLNEFIDSRSNEIAINKI